MDHPRRCRAAVWIARRTRAVAGEAGWTFVETLVVVAIILVLTSAVGFAAVRWIGRANRAAARTQMETFALCLASYYADTGVYPTQEQDLVALWEKPILEPVPAGWAGPYLERPVPLDPWGHAYTYRVPGPNNLPYGIQCLGADGREGGDGQAEDIESWAND